MSSSPLRYWCHGCAAEVQGATAVAEELQCPVCLCNFVEEMEPDTIENPAQASVHVLHHVRAAEPAVLPPDALPGDRRALQLQQMVQDMLASINQSPSVGTGAIRMPPSFPFVLPTMPLAGNIGDYGFGQSLQEIMDNLMTLDSNQRQGPPPASPESIRSMPTITVDEKLLAREKCADCAVCQERFSVGESIRQMSCEHCYHSPCIVPWLEQHNTCPVCRQQLNSA